MPLIVKGVHSDKSLLKLKELIKKQGYDKPEPKPKPTIK